LLDSPADVACAPLAIDGCRQVGQHLLDVATPEVTQQHVPKLRFPGVAYVTPIVLDRVDGLVGGHQLLYPLVKPASEGHTPVVGPRSGVELRQLDRQRLVRLGAGPETATGGLAALARGGVRPGVYGV
jgi:hypothetical protein